MIKCPTCQAENIINALYCNQCGAYLLEDDLKKTDPLAGDDTGWMGDTLEIESAARPQPGLAPAAIRLRIGPEKRVVEMSLEKPILIGRGDADSNIFPEIDVTDDIAPDKSVSRRHAVITKAENQVIVEDVGSINGTYVNGKRLASHNPEPLNNGDTLQCGKLLIEVELITNKADYG